MQINRPISVFGRGISNILESIIGKSCTKNLKLAKMKLFQLTPIRYAKSPVQADALFVLQIQVVMPGINSCPPRLLLLFRFARGYLLMVKLVSDKPVNGLSLSRKELICAKGRCGLLIKSKAIVFVVICNKSPLRPTITTTTAMVKTG